MPKMNLGYLILLPFVLIGLASMGNEKIGKQQSIGTVLCTCLTILQTKKPVPDCRQLSEYQATGLRFTSDKTSTRSAVTR